MGSDELRILFLQSYCYLHDHSPHSQSSKPHVLLYTHSGEQIQADTKSDAHRLIRNILKLVLRFLFLMITVTVTEFPSRPATRRIPITAAITLLLAGPSGFGQPVERIADENLF